MTEFNMMEDVQKWMLKSTQTKLLEKASLKAKGKVILPVTGKVIEITKLKQLEGLGQIGTKLDSRSSTGNKEPDH